MFQEELGAKRNTLGDVHEDTLDSITNMGLLLMDMGKLEEAKPLLEEALKASKEVLGESHRLACKCQEALAMME